MNTTHSELIDTQDVTIEINVDFDEPFREIRLNGWRICDDSMGRPVQHYADTFHLTPELAVELARALLNAAAALR